MNKTLQLFVNVDDTGEIINAQYGENIVATDEFNFFFLVDEEMIKEIQNYKVTLKGMKPMLVLKGGNANE